MQKNNSLFKRFFVAIRGFKFIFREIVLREKSFLLMLIAAVLVVFLMFYFPTTRLEKAVLFLTIFFVLISELVNSTVEKTLDIVYPFPNEKIKIIKDLMAAIVLLVSLVSVLIGILIFWQYLF